MRGGKTARNWPLARLFWSYSRLMLAAVKIISPAEGIGMRPCEFSTGECAADQRNPVTQDPDPFGPFDRSAPAVSREAA